MYISNSQFLNVHKSVGSFHLAPSSIKNIYSMYQKLCLVFTRTTCTIFYVLFSYSEKWTILRMLRGESYQIQYYKLFLTLILGLIDYGGDHFFFLGLIMMEISTTCKEGTTEIWDSWFWVHPKVLQFPPLLTKRGGIHDDSPIPISLLPL